jgi:hypothetical protein
MTLAEANGESEVLGKEFGWFREELGDFEFALTRPYFDLLEKISPIVEVCSASPSTLLPVKAVWSVLSL